jgi:hypothetical protein
MNKALSSNPSTANKKNQRGRFQGGNQREEAESMLPKVKSWRDAGDTWQEKPPRRAKTLTPPHPQPTHSIPTPH